MEWLCAKKIQDSEVFEKLFEIIGYQYPDEFRSFALQFNGATPAEDEFDTIQTEGRVLNRFLSFNKNDIETIWKFIDQNCSWSIEDLDWRYIPFANDPFGNYICFDRTNDHIVFWDHETGEVEEVADTFTVFINSLYESDE